MAKSYKERIEYDIMSKYILGIDTGGTYTDGVIIGMEHGKVIDAVKRPTTHHNLALGTVEVLQSLVTRKSVDLNQINHLAVSTTLATNAVVEKKGARVGLFVIGYVKHFRLPVIANVFIKGGHTITGEEEEPLDIESIIDTISGLKNDVDAYAICGAMSMENPSHELVAEKAIAMLDPKPVFCSHRVSIHAGMQGRAATAGLHAKLMPLMQDFIVGIQAAMVQEGLSCPVSIISGSTKPVSIHEAIDRAGITVASGPACTAHFGSMLAEADALVVDVGGTTTDLAMIKNSQPEMSPDGCRIGDWQTHIESINMMTGGIGGDSLVRLSGDGRMEIGPARVQPLAMSKTVMDIEKWLGPGDEAKCIVLPGDIELDEEIDEPILGYLQEHDSATFKKLKTDTGVSSVRLEKDLEKLASRKQIVEIGFTPTDALHVLDRISLGDKSRAEAGARVLAKLMTMNVEQFCLQVIQQTEEKIEELIIDYIITRNWGKSLTSFIGERNNHPELAVQFSLKVPIIGIGAAAASFLPGVAKRLGTKATFPPHCEVGNALGAAALIKKV